MKTRRRLAGALAALLLLPLGMVGWAAGLQMTGNVHAVEPGRLYRSGQLNGAALDDILTRHAIHTVVNLRDESSEGAWYADEIAIARKRGLLHIDIPMSATQEPDAATVSRLVAVLRTSPGPILVHCKSGADRAGFASALYQLAVAGRSPEVAAGQLSFRYGHFPWLGSRSIAMDKAFARIAAPYRERRR